MFVTTVVMSSSRSRVAVIALMELSVVDAWGYFKSCLQLHRLQQFPQAHRTTFAISSNFSLLSITMRHLPPLRDAHTAHSSPQKKVTGLLIENSVFIGGMNEAKCFEQRQTLARERGISRESIGRIIGGSICRSCTLQK